MLVKAITYFYQPVVLACDGRCDKAWGIQRRPRIKLSEDPDDYVYLADDELGEAPVDPGTYEGGCGKPAPPYTDPARQNKWCARECERGRMVQAEILVLPDFSRRLDNKPNRGEGR